MKNIFISTFLIFISLFKLSFVKAQTHKDTINENALYVFEQFETMSNLQVGETAYYAIPIAEMQMIDGKATDTLLKLLIRSFEIKDSTRGTFKVRNEAVISLYQRKCQEEWGTKIQYNSILYPNSKEPNHIKTSLKKVDEWEWNAVNLCGKRYIFTVVINDYKKSWDITSEKKMNK